MEVTQTGSVLTLANVTVSDAGVFTCLAHNGVPRDQPVTIREQLYLLVNRKSGIKYQILYFIGISRKTDKSFPLF